MPKPIRVRMRPATPTTKPQPRAGRHHHRDHDKLFAGAERRHTGLQTPLDHRKRFSGSRRPPHYGSGDPNQPWCSQGGYVSDEHGAPMTFKNLKKKTANRRSGSAGFTMIEMLVAVGLFVIIGGAAISLFKQHAPLFTQQQALTGLNVTMRNAMAEMQMDVVNAGSGFYPGTNFQTGRLASPSKTTLLAATATTRRRRPTLPHASIR